MEGVGRAHSSDPKPPPPSKLGMHRDSHVISKLVKPKVRIIHIFAPEIIKTDAADFRELVQRLTGQPCESKGLIRKKAGSSGTADKRKKSTAGSSICDQSNKTPMHQLPELGLPSLIRSEKLKVGVEANKMWGGECSSSNCNFLDGFGDLNGFIHDLSDNFPLTATNSQSYHEMDVYEDIYTPF
uniref:VQ domain-containing protein n=1 Tax=Salix viminalis TaxID=40686 RepID=A0A6N2K494_SALVM